MYHRDLKPANILIDHNGQPKVADFGLAVKEFEQYLHPGAGTPAYMSPEQIQRTVSAWEAPDIWAIGVILYEALIGERPFPTPSDVLNSDFTPRPLLGRRPALEGELGRNRAIQLAAICERCLRRETKGKDCRYESAQFVAIDLRTLLESPSENARISTSYDTALKTPLIVATAPAVQRSSQFSEEVQFQTPPGDILAVAFSSDGGPVMLEACGESVRLWDIRSGLKLQEFMGIGGAVKCAALSNDGQLVLTGSTDRFMRLWTVVDGKEQCRFGPHDHLVDSVAFSADGRYALSGNHRKACLWNLTQDQRIAFFNADSAICCVALSESARHLFAGSDSSAVWRADHENGWRPAVCYKQNSAVRSVACTADGRRVVSVGDDGHLWWFDGGKPRSLGRKHNGRVDCLALSRDGSRALSGGRDGKVFAWNLLSGTATPLTGHSAAVRSLAFDAERNDRGLSAGKDKIVRVYPLP